MRVVLNSHSPVTGISPELPEVTQRVGGRTRVRYLNQGLLLSQSLRERGKVELVPTLSPHPQSIDPEVPTTGLAPCRGP